MAQFEISRVAFDDDLNDVRMVFELRGSGTIADRLHVAVVAPSDADEKPHISGEGLVKDAVSAGAITIAEGQALKTTLGKLYSHLLGKYA